MVTDIRCIRRSGFFHFAAIVFIFGSNISECVTYTLQLNFIGVEQVVVVASDMD